MKKYLVLLVPLLFLMAQCHKDPPVHVNKFTCKVNGEFWEAVPKERSIFGNSLQAQESPLGEIFIYAFNAAKNESINFSFNPNGIQGAISIKTENPFSTSIDLKCGNFILDTMKINQVVIDKFDKERKLIQGSFQLTALNKEGRCSNATITEGVFDLSF